MDKHEVWVTGEATLSRRMVANQVATRLDSAVVHEQDGDPGPIRLGLANGRWMCITESGSLASAAAKAITAGACAVVAFNSAWADWGESLDALLDRRREPFVAADLLLALARLTKDQELLTIGPDEIGVRLTPREAAVLDCLSAGMSNGKIAEALVLSIGTVRTHLASIALKLGTTSRAGLIAAGQRRARSDLTGARESGRAIRSQASR